MVKDGRGRVRNAVSRRQSAERSMRTGVRAPSTTPFLTVGLLPQAITKMPRGASRHFEVRPVYVSADSRPAKDTAAIAVAPVSITGVLSIALFIALHEAAAKGLRRSVPVKV